MTSTQTKARTRNGILMTGLTLLALALAIALTTACGSSWGEGGDPAEIVAGFAFELELYDVDVYMEQNIPDALRDSFENTRAEFERYGIDFDDVNNLAKALVDCCAYSNVTQLQGSAYTSSTALSSLIRSVARWKRSCTSPVSPADTRYGRTGLYPRALCFLTGWQSDSCRMRATC